MKTLAINREKYPAAFVGCKNFGQLVSWVENLGEKR